MVTIASPTSALSVAVTVTVRGRFQFVGVKTGAGERVTMVPAGTTVGVTDTSALGAALSTTVQVAASPSGMVRAVGASVTPGGVGCVTSRKPV